MPSKIWKDESDIQSCNYIRFGNSLATETNSRQSYWSIWKIRLCYTSKTCFEDPNQLLVATYKVDSFELILRRQIFEISCFKMVQITLEYLFKTYMVVHLSVLNMIFYFGEVLMVVKQLE